MEFKYKISVYNKELKILIQKGKEQNFVFRSEADIKQESENKLKIFFEKIFNNFTIKLYSFPNKDLMNIAFEFIYRFKEIRNEIILKGFKTIINNNELSEQEKEYSISDILRFSFLLTKYDLLKLTVEETQKTYNDLSQLLIKKGLENLNTDDIRRIMFNFTRNQFEVSIDLFTLLEPYIIRDINQYSLKSLIYIFIAYIKNYIGTDFFIKNIGFNIGARLKEANIEGNII